MFYIFLPFYLTSLWGKEYFGKLNQVRSRSHLKKTRSRSRSLLGKKIRSRSRLKKKSGAGAGAGKKFAGPQALTRTPPPHPIPKYNQYIFFILRGEIIKYQTVDTVLNLRQEPGKNIHPRLEIELLAPDTSAASRAGEPANFFPAPAPDFFFKRLRLLIFFPSGSGSGPWFVFQAARLRLQGAKNTLLRPAPAPAPDYWLSLPKYSFPHKLVR